MQQQLEIRWILDRGCLRLIWTARQPQPLPINPPQPTAPELEKQAA